MKKLLSLVLALVLLSSLGFALAAEKTYRIGIAQFAVHGSLDNCRLGFLEGLKDAGFEEGRNLVVDYQNAQADMGIAAAIAAAFVDTQVDLICAIATPMAVLSNNASDGKIPVIYSAVSAPKEAGLANAQGLGEGSTTGTSDELPVRQQLETIRALQPQAKVIGILYTLGEVNSQVQLGQYQDLAGAFGFTVEASGISAGPDIALALPALLGKVDLLTMLLDNTVVQYLDTVLDAADPANIPVYGSEIEQVKRGCVAAEGLDYLALGRQTGALAARVLKGEPAGSIPFQLIQESALYYNAEAIKARGLTLPEDLLARGQEVGK
ncbi:MAG: ABC transporter substrate-binding protein [Christensenellales bacterium]